MIIILSPAKTFNKLNYKSNKKIMFLNKTMNLVNILKTYTVEELMEKLNISYNLATNAYNHYNNFKLEYTAIYLYGGQAFKYLKAQNIKKENLKNLYILSPLYGLVNSLDNISPYRLDMKDKIIDLSLYNYWYDDINKKLKELNKVIINLSSGEFTKLLDLNNSNIYTINFAVIDNNKLTQQSMLMKKLRGLMANYLLVNQINDINKIKEINLEGFKYNNKHSNKNLLMFTKNK